MIRKVLVITKGDKGDKTLLRQTSGYNGLWRAADHPDCNIKHDYQFFVNEYDADVDFVVVRGKTLKEKLTVNVAPQNIILTTSEPYSILAYPKSYCKQFSLVCSCQDNLTGSNVVYTPPVLLWFAGIEFLPGREDIAYDYDDFMKMQMPEKTRLLSVVSSNKVFTQGHQDRLRFVERLKEHFGDRLDVFGRGIRDFKDKWEVLAPYKYHIAIENSQSPYYFTEKLTDTYIAGAFPFYYGCSNITDYYPKDAMRCIDINNPDEAISIIEDAIANNAYEKNLEALMSSRRASLENYNMFNIIAENLESLNADLPKQKVEIKPCSIYTDLHNIKLDFIDRNLFKIKYKLEKLIK